MATIIFSNNELPLGGLNFNPGFEEVLDATPALGLANKMICELINNDGGAFDGFSIRFFSNANGTGDFDYFVVGETGEVRPSGTIAGVAIFAPDGTVIAEAGSDGTPFGDTRLQDFYARLTATDASSAAEAISNAFGGLFGATNVMTGSNAADHLKAFADSTAMEIHGRGGNDLITAPGPYPRLLVGGDGNDTIRVGNGQYQLHGGRANGTGLDGDIDTLEVVATGDDSVSPELTAFTNIDVIRFTALDAPPASEDGAGVGASIRLSPGGLPKQVAVEGSTVAVANSWNLLSIYRQEDPAAKKGVEIDLSRWTFKGWDEARSEINLTTNVAPLALRDVVVGSRMADSIFANGGADLIRGGGGADALHGDGGNDRFLFGRGEAEAGEQVIGGYNNKADGNADTVVVLADNDFAGVAFRNIERLEFDGKATAAFAGAVVGNKGAIVTGDGKANAIAIDLGEASGDARGIDLGSLTLRSWTAGKDTIAVAGTGAKESIGGSSGEDAIAGGGGADMLRGRGGADTFVFDARLGTGIDRIADFSRAQGDSIELDSAVFAGLKSATVKGSGVLKDSAFGFGSAADNAGERILYDRKSGTLRYDDDGPGKHKAVTIAVLDDGPALKAGDIIVA